MSELPNYSSVIHSVIPDVTNIAMPSIKGSQRNVFIANSDNGKFVCKFNHRDLAIKNSIVSELLSSNGINVPKIKVVNYSNYWIEIYPMIDGETLYSRIGAGLPEHKINDVYYDIVDNFAKMDAVSSDVLNQKSTIKHTHQVANINISDTTNKVIAKIFSDAIRLINKTADKNVGLYHCGMTPKNTILNNDDKLNGFVDLDEVAICDKNYAFGMMAAKYQLLGKNPMRLIEYYEDATGKELNHKKIKGMINIINTSKTILWHTNNLIKKR